LCTLSGIGNINIEVVRPWQH